MAKVEFMYTMKIDVLCNENDTLEIIVQKFCQKVLKKKEDFVFLYGGQMINMNSTFYNLANPIDRQRKIITIVVTDAYAKNQTIYINQIKALKDNLNSSKIIIEKQNEEIQNLKYQIAMIKSEDTNKINNLLNIIEQKDEQIKKLKEQLNNPINGNIPNKKIVIHFKSSNPYINDLSITCLNNNLFSEVEKILYRKYPEFRDRENLFLGHGKKILSNKTIYENGIEDKETILIYEMDKF